MLLHSSVFRKHFHYEYSPMALYDHKVEPYLLLFDCFRRKGEGRFLCPRLEKSPATKN